MYDDVAALYPGAVFPGRGDPSFPVTEVIAMEKRKPGAGALRQQALPREIEALGIAQRIQSHGRQRKNVDKETG